MKHRIWIALRPFWRWRGLAMTGLLASWAAPACSGPTSVGKSPPGAVQERTLAEMWGVQVQSLRLTAGGNLIDFRYKVLDPAKAAPLLDRRMKRMVLEDRSTGARSFVPLAEQVGSLRQTTLAPSPGRTYYALFANPGGFIHTGARVDVTIGDFTARDLTVE